MPEDAPRVMTLRRLRESLGDVLMSGDKPVVVTKDGVPVGFFIPARVWKAQEASEAARSLVKLVLVHAGYSMEDVTRSISDLNPDRRRPLMAALKRKS